MSPRGAASPTVSVIINTVDRANWLARTLEAVTRLRYPAYEIVVVPGPCKDSTDEVLTRHRNRIRVTPWPERNLAAARNGGVAAAAGEILAFIDDDALPEPDWLDHLVEGFGDPGVGVIGGYIRKPNGRDWEDRVRIANRLGGLKRTGAWSGRLGPGEYVSPTGANVAYRRAAVEAIGGFDPEYAYFFEETDLHLRLADAGWRGGFAPAAEVYHYRAESSTRDARSRPRSEYRIARSKAYFVWKHARATHSRLEMESSVGSFTAGRGAWILGLCALGAVSPADARRLLGELGCGAADGKVAALATLGGPVGPAPIAPNRDGRALLPWPRPDAPPMRLGWIVGPDAATRSAVLTDQLLRAWAAAGHEVTVIEPAPGAPEVVRAEGVWRHKVGPARLYERAACREVERIQPHRHFEAVLAPDGFQALRSSLDRLGVMAHPVPGSDSDPRTLEQGILSARPSATAVGACQSFGPEVAQGRRRGAPV